MNRLWLCLPFAVVFLIDIGLTLAGQPAAYWAGDPRCINEGFSIFAWALSQGLWGVVGVSLGWLVVFSILILTIPRLLAEILSLALVIGHTWGAMTWLVYQTNLNYHVCLLYVVFAATLFMVSYRKWQTVDRASPDAL